LVARFAQGVDLLATGLGAFDRSVTLFLQVTGTPLRAITLRPRSGQLRW
jgi:hypothetical protein